MFVGGYKQATLLVYTNVQPGEKPPLRGDGSNLYDFDATRMLQKDFTRDKAYDAWAKRLPAKLADFYDNFLSFYNEAQTDATAAQMREVLTQLDERGLINGDDIDAAFEDPAETRLRRRSQVA
jgi:hypothetical protein